MDRNGEREQERERESNVIEEVRRRRPERWSGVCN